MEMQDTVSKIEDKTRDLGRYLEAIKAFDTGSVMREMSVPYTMSFKLGNKYAKAVTLLVREDIVERVVILKDDIRTLTEQLTATLEERE